jgi:pimeloyl-ACP methyl ester carboxylesterase
MEPPAEENAPIVRTETAVKDVGAAVDFILKRRGISRINLMGWSWGTATMGCYAGQYGEKVNKLVLYAPRWLSNTPSLMDSGGKLGAYRTVTVESARERWWKGVAEDKRAGLIPPGWFEAWAAATFATDPVGARSNPPVLRAPNGTLQDTREYWSAGKPLYDPATIRAPVLLVHAEWDQDLPSDMLHAYFAKLTNARYKGCVEIGEGAHGHHGEEPYAALPGGPDTSRRGHRARGMTAARTAIRRPSHNGRPLVPTLEQVARSGTEICSVLEAAHTKEIVHHDLEPGNVMVTDVGSAAQCLMRASIAAASPSEPAARSDFA